MKRKYIYPLYSIWTFEKKVPGYLVQDPGDPRIPAGYLVQVPGSPRDSAEYLVQVLFVEYGPLQRETLLSSVSARRLDIILWS